MERRMPTRPMVRVPMEVDGSVLVVGLVDRLWRSWQYPVLVLHHGRLVGIVAPCDVNAGPREYPHPLAPKAYAPDMARTAERRV